jgi:hypothetical protein
VKLATIFVSSPSTVGQKPGPQVTGDPGTVFVLQYEAAAHCAQYLRLDTTSLLTVVAGRVSVLVVCFQRYAETLADL